MKIRPVVTYYIIELTECEVRHIKRQVKEFKGTGNPLYYSNEIGNLINLINNFRVPDDGDV